MAKHSYDKEFREGVIQYCLDYTDESYVSISKRFGVHDTTIGGWMKDYKKNDNEVIVRGSGNYSSDEAKEIARLRKELKDTQDALDILKKGVGHSSGSYFPGEGGSIIYMGHNSKKMFRRFSELQKGNEIKVKTSYGEYVYKIYDMQLIKETEVDKLPIQRDKEILMVYTCYPFNNVGYATQRYVVYAELEK